MKPHFTSNPVEYAAGLGVGILCGVLCEEAGWGLEALELAIVLMIWVIYKRERKES